MAGNCTVGYEVSLTIPGLKTVRSVVFTNRSKAKSFKAKYPGSKLAAVQLCDGVIFKRGKKVF